MQLNIKEGITVSKLFDLIHADKVSAKTAVI